MKRLFFPLLIFISIILISFSVSKKPSAKQALKLLEGFCQFVPSGNAIYNDDTISVQSFYISNEITNIQYSEFLYSLERRGEIEKLKIAQIDTTGWIEKFPNGYLNPMSKHYHKHPAYHKYPVVNISKAGAQLYCEWLTEVYDSLSNGELGLKFRIPLRAEWIRAARGDDHQRVYTWQGTRLHKKDGKSNFHGQIQANCIQNGAESITRNPETNELEFVYADYQSEDLAGDGAFLTAPSESYWPNQFGLFNMNGNVSEMIADGSYAVGGDWYSPGYDIRNESIKPISGSHPTVGFRIVATHVSSQK